MNNLKFDNIEKFLLIVAGIVIVMLSYYLSIDYDNLFGSPATEQESCVEVSIMTDTEGNTWEIKTEKRLISTVESEGV